MEGCFIVSVVTKERFEQGLLYNDYLSSVNVNKDADRWSIQTFIHCNNMEIK